MPEDWQDLLINAGKSKFSRTITAISLSGLPETTDCSATGAICHTDGRKLSNSSSRTVQGPVGISVADATVTEGASTIDFTVSLSRTSTNTIIVDYTTEKSLRDCRTGLYF